jgi:hypothetical protein
MGYAASSEILMSLFPCIIKFVFFHKDVMKLFDVITATSPVQLYDTLLDAIL